MTATLDIQDDIALIQLDDGKANVVGYAFLETVNDALDKAEVDAKAIVLSGRSGVFSGGFDLKIMRDAPPDEVSKLVSAGGALALRLFACPKPTLAAVTGHALAMGAILLTAMDTRIGAAGDFKIGLNETAIGMTLPPFGFILPGARLHPNHYTKAIIQAHLYDPEEAAIAGFLDRVTSPDGVLESTLETAGELAQLDPAAYAGNKRGIRHAVIGALKAAQS